MKSRRSLLKVLLFIVFVFSVWLLGRRWSYYPSKLEIIIPSDRFVTKFKKSVWRPASVKKIFLWTKQFRSWWWLSEAKQSLPTCSNRCVVTNSVEELNSSDAVLFHCEDIWKNRRSLFATLYNTLNEMPKYRNPSQVWVFWSLEPVSHTYGVLPHDTFNWTAHYRKDSTIFTPYDRYVKKTESELNESGFLSNFKRDYLKDKTKMAVIVESNCQDQSRRHRLVAEISKYIHVDQFGECSNNVICPKSYSQETCDNYINHYKFYLAFENSICQDYITEKFWRTIVNRHQIPVVAASSATLELLPPKSYLNVFDFPSIKELTNKMKEISSNATLYNSYFKWMTYYKRDDEHAFCKLCKALHENRTPQVYHDLEGWTKHDSCAKLSPWRMIFQHVDRFLYDWGIW